MPSHLQGEKLALSKCQNNIQNAVLVGSSGTKSAETEHLSSGKNIQALISKTLHLSQEANPLTV